MLRLLKAFRLARLARVRVLGLSAESLFASPYMKVGRFMAMLALLSHWCACLFHVVALIEEDNERANWVSEEDLSDAPSQTRQYSFQKEAHSKHFCLGISIVFIFHWRR